MDFELAEGIYSRATIPEADSVCLWLGANVMLEYTCEEVSSSYLSHLLLGEINQDIFFPLKLKGHQKNRIV